MEKDRGFKIIAIVALLIAVVGLSIAYAGYTASLNIEGTATVAGDTWKIEWTDLGAGTVTGKASIDGASFQIDASKQTVSGVVGTLNGPGDSISYSWKATNNGKLDAQVSGVTYGALTCTSEAQAEADAVCDELTLEVKYNGITIAADTQATTLGDLNIGESKDASLTLTWNAAGVATVTKPVTVAIGKTTFTYEQKNA